MRGAAQHGARVAVEAIQVNFLAGEANAAFNKKHKVAFPQEIIHVVKVMPLDF